MPFLINLFEKFIHCHEHLPLVSVLHQLYPVYASCPNLFKIYLNIILPLTIKSSELSLYFSFDH